MRKGHTARSVTKHLNSLKLSIMISKRRQDNLDRGVKSNYFSFWDSCVQLKAQEGKKGKALFYKAFPYKMKIGILDSLSYLFKTPTLIHM